MLLCSFKCCMAWPTFIQMKQKREDWRERSKSPELWNGVFSLTLPVSMGPSMAVPADQCQLILPAGHRVGILGSSGHRVLCSGDCSLLWHPPDIVLILSWHPPDILLTFSSRPLGLSRAGALLDFSPFQRGLQALQAKLLRIQNHLQCPFLVLEKRLPVPESNAVTLSDQRGSASRVCWPLLLDYSILWGVGRSSTGTHTSQLWGQQLVSLVPWALLSIPGHSCGALGLQSELSGSVSCSFHLLLGPLSLLYWVGLQQMQHRSWGESRSCHREYCISSLLPNWGSEGVVWCFMLFRNMLQENVIPK